jgi:hypothetical protein
MLLTLRWGISTKPEGLSAPGCRAEINQSVSIGLATMVFFDVGIHFFHFSMTEIRNQDNIFHKK